MYETNMRKLVNWPLGVWKRLIVQSCVVTKKNNSCISYNEPRRYMKTCQDEVVSLDYY